MAARQWTQAQRERQAKLIHGWKPWEKSTGAVTERGKALASKNAINYSLREVMRYSSRTNKELCQQLEPFVRLSNWMESCGLFAQITPALCKQDPTILDALLADFEKAWAEKFGG
jgi:hypothetical protein